VKGARPLRLAAIDCGTNTVLLTVAELRRGQLVPIDERAEITRLGEGLAGSGALREEAIARTAQVFAVYVEAIEQASCDHVLAVGTEALRRASNGDEARARFDALLARVGGRLEIIAGPREAQLSFGAIADSFPALRRARTVVDIGGGSTELVVGNQKIDALCSLPIGSVVLTEQHLAHDPPTVEERAALRAHVEKALEAAPPLHKTVVGIAGTVTTFAAISLGLNSYDATRVHGLVLSREDLDRQVERLGSMPLNDRRRTPGLQPKRADVIYAGGVILSCVLGRARASGCLVSDRGVRWGLLYEAARAAPRPESR
jgi:exopolyphosphatase/guanosine-5'-triphosphate,3'-diphosphate pyrophosphatase